MSRSSSARTPEPAASPFRVIRQQRLYEQIAEQIEEFIRARDLKAGDRIPAERELAVEFGVSRPSVREAMIALETAGLIEVRTGEGTFVRRVVPRGMPVLSWSQSDPGPGALEQFEAREAIEPEVAALAAGRVTGAQLAELAGWIAAAAARFAKGELADEEDHAFHVRLAEFSGNLILAGVVRHLWDLRASEMWRVIRARVAQPEHRTQTIEYRRAILAALERGDPDGARAAMRRLVTWARGRYFGQP